MAIKRLLDLVVGTKISVGGEKYKVAYNGPVGVLLQKEITRGIYTSDKVQASSVVRGYTGVSTTYVTVVEETSDSQSDLTSKLRAQVKQNSLTESLRAQVEEQEQDEDEEEGDTWEIPVDDEPEEAVSYEPIQAAQYAGRVSFIQPGQITLQESPVSVPGVEEAKKSALTANLRSQQAVQAAQSASSQAVKADLRAQTASQVSNQARFEASIAKAKGTKALASVDSLNNAVSSIDHDVASLRQETENVRDYAYSVSDVAHNALRKAEAVEAKQKEEEKKVSLQNELNRKLAAKKNESNVQAQLNQKLNQKSGGNGTMKNVLGAIKNQFGKVEGKFAFSIVTGGLALRKGISQEYVAYDKASKGLTDVSGLTLKFDVPAFKLPVAADQVAVGDLVIHNAEYVYVTKKVDGYLEVLNPEKGVRGSVVPTKNAILGAAFYTVVKTLDAAGDGGFNPMLLMALGDGNKDELVKIMALTGGFGGGAQNGAIDPMMMMLLGDNLDDILPFVLMQQGGALGGNAAQGGLQAILPLLLMGDKGGKSKDLLPFLAMTGGLGGAQGQAGAINPMMLMALSGDGDMDPMTLMALSGGFGGQGLFGQAPAQAPAAPAPAENDKK